MTRLGKCVVDEGNPGLGRGCDAEFALCHKLMTKRRQQFSELRDFAAVRRGDDDAVCGVASATKAVASRRRLSPQPKPPYHPVDFAANAAESDRLLAYGHIQRLLETEGFDASIRQFHADLEAQHFGAVEVERREIVDRAVVVDLPESAARGTVREG